MPDRPRVLIEDWLPVAELGIESRREAAPIPGQFPKLKTLHVWWARRPLVARAGAVLGSVHAGMVACTGVPVPRPCRAQDRGCAIDHGSFGSVAFSGDPSPQGPMQLRRRGGTGLQGPTAYGYNQAFKNPPPERRLSVLQQVLGSNMAGELPCLVDSTAGGGSIPFEAVRYGIAGVRKRPEPNRSCGLAGRVELPAAYGPSSPPISKPRVSRLCPPPATTSSCHISSSTDHTERVTSYLFARTITCPRTGQVGAAVPELVASKGPGPSCCAASHFSETEASRRSRSSRSLTGAGIDFTPDVGTARRAVMPCRRGTTCDRR